MVLAVVDHLGDCPPSDKGVGCENGTHAVRVLLLAKWKCYSPEGGLLVATWWWAGVKEQSTRIVVCDATSLYLILS
jgi:hypothetical protein